MSEYKPTDRELALAKKWALERNMAKWSPEEKWEFLCYLNKVADLPLGTTNSIGILRTSSKKETKDGWIEDPASIKESPYAERGVTAMLAKKHCLSQQLIEKVIKDNTAIYTARISEASGRFTESVGAVSLDKLAGDRLANKIMHCETKAKRRAILDHCGLGMLDDVETESMPGAAPVELPPPVATTIATGKKSEIAEAAEAQIKNQVAAAKQGGAGNAAGAGKTVATSQDSQPPRATATALVTSTEAPKQELPAGVHQTPPVTTVANTGADASYGDNPLFQGDDNAIVADKAHVDFIIFKATEEAAWASQDMSRWLLETHGVQKSNMSQTLTLAKFKLIIKGIDTAIANQKKGA